MTVMLIYNSQAFQILGAELEASDDLFLSLLRSSLLVTSVTVSLRFVYSLLLEALRRPSSLCNTSEQYAVL